MTDLEAFVLKILASKGIDKALEKINLNKNQFEKKLTKIIEDTIKEYEKENPYKTDGNKSPFYEFQIFFDELSKYQFYKKNNTINYKEIVEKLKENTNILIPTEKEINNFFEKFYTNINNDDNLKDLYIDENYKEEIFDISKKIDDICERIPEIPDQLPIEFKRQLQLCKDYVEEFKPQTALNWLDHLEKAMENESLSGNLMAYLYFIKAKCFEYLYDEKVWAHFVKAYKNDPENITYQEVACYAYQYLDQKKEASELATKILKKDDFNIYAWFVITTNNLVSDETRKLDRIPNTVKDNKRFKRIMYAWVRNKNRNDLFDILRSVEIYPEIDNNIPESIDYHNFSHWVFIFIIHIDHYLKNEKIYFDEPIVKNDAILYINHLSEKLKTIIEESEIEGENIEILFYYYWSDLELNGNVQSLEKMKRIYSRLDFNNIVIIYLLANSLQKNGDKQLAIQFINDSNSSSDRGLLLLKAFCLSSLDKQDDFLKTLLNYIKILDKIDNTELGNILQLISPNVISFENKAVLKYSLKKINFTKQLYHNLIDCYLDCFYAFDESQDYIISLLKQLDSIDNQIITEDENLKIFIAQSYFTLGEYKKVIDNLKLRIKKDQESYELLLYIKALFYNKQDNIELLKLLKLWRENFSFNKFFLRIEIDFRKIINDWKEIEIIADFALQNLENSEDFLTIYMLSLSINEKNEKLKEIIEKIQNHDFQEIQNALLTAKICFESGYPKIAFDIVYKKAIDPKNKRAREIYFVSHINFPKEYFKEYQKVEYNTFVKYIEDGNFKYIEISEKDTHENSLAKKIIGKKVNDEIVLSTPMTSKIYKIRIIRIMNKYLSLLDEINEESQSVSSGYSFEWIKLDKNDIEKTFIETLGIKSTEDKKQKIKNLTDYHNYKIPFSYVTASVFEKNYIKSYSYLTGAQSDGFNITPLYLYNTSINFENSKFIIDYSSALLFFNLSKELGIDFQDKFIVPKTLMIDLEDMIKSVKNMPQPELGVEITQERIHSYSYPKDYKKNYLIFLQNFHDWIEKYAKIELPEKKVEIAHILKDTNDSDGYINYLFDNYYLARNDNYILVTDDQFYFQFFHPHSGKIISTELFLANLFPERKNEIYQLLIERNYIGITVYKEILMQFYLKKVSAQDVNRYFKCLSNLSLVINPSVFTIEQAIEFLQELSFKPISKKQFEREAKVVFGFLIRDIKDKDTINFIKEVIGNKFNLLQDYLDITLISFNDALAINILN